MSVKAVISRSPHFWSMIGDPEAALILEQYYWELCKFGTGLPERGETAAQNHQLHGSHPEACPRGKP
jgi:hypothetical protein